jgi:hypothetical protein
LDFLGIYFADNLSPFPVHLYYSSDIFRICFSESFSYVDADWVAAFVSF